MSEPLELELQVLVSIWFWDSNLSPSEEQPIRLAAELSLQALVLRQGLCSPEWPGVHRDLPASVSYMLRRRDTDKQHPLQLPLCGAGIEAGASCVAGGACYRPASQLPKTI